MLLGAAALTSCVIRALISLTVLLDIPWTVSNLIANTVEQLS